MSSTSEKVTFTRWCDIEQLHNLVTSISKSQNQLESKGEPIKPFDLAFGKEIQYRGKVKLHGTNAAITISEHGMRPQSRNQFLDDASGMGKILNANKQFFQSLFDVNAGYKQVCVFGEYAGKGVQPKVALSQLNVNIFAVFAIQFDEKDILIDPAQIQQFMTRNSPLPSHVYILPWHTPVFSLALTNPTLLDEEAEKINQIVQQIDALDPWVLENFGKSGHGEGLVLYPVSLCDQERSSYITRELFEAFVFKAKGQNHQVVKMKSSTQVTPSSASNVDAFADLLATEARLQQGVQEIGGLDPKKTLDFVNWVKKDVQKEGNDELEASNLSWKEVLPAIGKKASTWYVQQAKKK